jgi:hypothetical protein
MATLNNSTIYDNSNEIITSSDQTPQPLPIKTSGQGWPKNN